MKIICNKKEYSQLIRNCVWCSSHDCGLCLFSDCGECNGVETLFEFEVTNEQQK